MIKDQTIKENAAGKVKGKRSPRWAFMQRMTIPCKDGTDYLVRLRILQTPLFGIYLHDIHEDDGDSPPHNHPWSFASIVLRGDYTERLWPNPRQGWRFVDVRHRAGSIHFMDRKSAHRIIETSAGLKTLIFTGPRCDTWGFFEDGRFIEWMHHVRGGA